MFSHADPVCGLLPAGTLTLFEEFCKIFCFYFDFKSAIMMAFRWNTLSSWICSEVRTFTGQSCWSSKEIFFYADFRIAELRDCTSAVKKGDFLLHITLQNPIWSVSQIRHWSWGYEADMQLFTHINPVPKLPLVLLFICYDCRAFFFRVDFKMENEHRNPRCFTVFNFFCQCVKILTSLGLS